MIDKLKQVNQVIVTSHQISANKNAIDQFKTQLTQLNTVTVQLEGALSIAQEFVAAGLVDAVIPQEVKTSLLESINACGEKTDAQILDSSTVTALRNAIVLLKSNVDNTWKQSAEKKSANAVNSLRSLRPLLSDKTEADKLINEVDDAKKTTPLSTKSVRLFIEKVDRIQSIVNGLDPGDIDISNFIIKVRNQQATVDDLTPKILGWFKTKGLTKQLKIRFF